DGSHCDLRSFPTRRSSDLSAWYSGNPNLHMSTRSQPGGPSIKGYVDSVIAKAYKYPSGGSSSNFSTGSTATPKLSSAELAEQYRSEEHTSELQSRENRVCR